MIAVLLAVVLKAFFVQAFYIPSESMEPGLVKNDRILVQKVSYWGGGGPQRGDVVVFEDPGGWLGPEDVAGPENPVAKALEKIGLYPSGGHLVKRVIGVAGDTIICCDDQGRISVNGTSVDEKGYTLPGEIDQHDCFGPMTGNCSWTRRPGARRARLRHGRQPRPLGRLDGAHVPRGRDRRAPRTRTSTRT